MDTAKMKQLSELKYPDSVKFALYRGRIAVMGPITFDAMHMIEERFGSVEAMQKALTADPPKQTDLFAMVYICLENKEEFEGEKDFAKYVTFTHMPELIELLYHFMSRSLPEVDEAEVEAAVAAVENGEVAEEKKEVG